MKLDRELQRAILQCLAEAYPRGTSAVYSIDPDEERVIANLCYLEELGLLESGVKLGINSGTVTRAKITARGLDFLQDDGGLSSILGVVTIKLHEDTLRQLIEARILGADIPEDEKTGILQALKQAPAESIKHLTLRLLDSGLEQLPKAIQILQTCLQSAPL